MSAEHNVKKLKEAVAYLRSRNLYLMDEGNRFVPTNAAQTDVTKTIARYRAQAEGVQIIKEVKRRI